MHHSINLLTLVSLVLLPSTVWSIDCLYPEWKTTCQKTCLDRSYYNIQFNRCYSQNESDLMCVCNDQDLTKEMIALMKGGVGGQAPPAADAGTAGPIPAVASLPSPASAVSPNSPTPNSSQEASPSAMVPTATHGTGLMPASKPMSKTSTFGETPAHAALAVPPSQETVPAAKTEEVATPVPVSPATQQSTPTYNEDTNNVGNGSGGTCADGQMKCSSDGSSFTTCIGGVYTVPRACAPGTKCASSGESIVCGW